MKRKFDGQAIQHIRENMEQIIENWANRGPGDVVEKVWSTEAGYPAIVKMLDIGHRCGYVAVNKSSKFYGKPWLDLAFDVHGGVTFTEDYIPEYTTEKTDLWFIGFDCAHSGDLYPGQKKSLNYCITECERLAQQIKEQE